MDDVTKIVTDVKASVEAFKSENAALVKALESTTAMNASEVKAATARLDEMAMSVQAHAQNIVALEQKLADGVQRGKAAVETLGQMVVKNEKFKEFAAGKTTKMRIEANTIIGQEGSPPTNSDTLVAPDRMGRIIPGAFRLLRVRDVLPAGTTSSNAVEYTRELSFTNDAAEVAEAAAKPESDLTFELISSPVRTIAHWIKASKQILDDAPALQTYIDNRLRYGVDFRIDTQLVNGNGTGQNISGLLDSGNFTAFTPTVGENALDGLNRAKYAIIGREYAPTAVMMNPADWGNIERIKKGTDDVSYVVGNPLGRIDPLLWGVPVVVSNSVPAGTFIMGDFNISHMVFNRMGTVVEMAETDSDNFTKNLVTIRAEARMMLATFVPAAVSAGLLVDAGT